MKIVLIIIFLQFNSCVFAQIYSDSNSENKFIAICKAIASVEELSDSSFLCEYDENKSLFILSKTEFVKNPDRKINVKVNNVDLSIWFRKDLFFHNILYWLELTEITEDKDKIKVKLRSFNSVNTQEKKSLIIGEIILKINDGEYVVLEKNIDVKLPD